jgi:hypothetical protein
MKLDTNDKQVSPAIKILLVIIGILLLPIILIAAIAYYLWSLILSSLIWVAWGLQGRNVLFVHSESPIWSDYIEQEILPQIAKTAVILNWSERKQWKISLAVLAFKLYGGTRDFNPMAIVFRPFRLHKIFRFYKAFKDFKHGQTEPLEKIRPDFLQLVKRQ